MALNLYILTQSESNEVNYSTKCMFCLLIPEQNKNDINGKLNNKEIV